MCLNIDPELWEGALDLLSQLEHTVKIKGMPAI